jgi:Protein of unknown function (DUF3800)
MSALPYQVIAVAIKKDEHLARYQAAAADPYHLALEWLIERYLRFLSGRTGAILAESRNPTLDARLQITYQRLLAFGTSHVRGEAIAHAFPPPLPVEPKSAGSVGLQLADLVVTPIGRHVMGKPDRDDWGVIRSKFRRSPSGDFLGWGLKVFP